MKDVKVIAKKVLDELTTAGADMALVSVSSGYGSELNVDGGEISLMRTIFSDKVSMKAIKNMRKGVISLNSFGDDEIHEAVRNCIEAADSGVEDEALSISPLTENSDFVDGILVPDMDKLFMRIREYMDSVEKEFPEIIIEQLIVTYTHSHRCMMNTNGVCYGDETGLYSMSSMFSAHRGDISTSFNSVGFDFLDLDKPLLDMYNQREYYARSVAELDAEPFEDKFTGKILCTPDMFCEFVGTALSNFISDGPIIEKTSPWKDKLGQKVTSEKLSVRSIPNDERMICASKVHADGYLNEDCDYIRDGVLVSFDLSEYGANKTGGERAKSSSACCEIPGGDIPLADMIKSIDKGLFVCRFSGGEASSNGDISGVAKNSFLIENGKITHAVTETMISGNLEDMLNNIVALSKETICDGGSVLPYAIIDGVTVSGKSDG